MTPEELKRLCLSKGFAVAPLHPALQWKPGVVVAVPYGDRKLQEFEENPGLKLGPSGRSYTIIEIREG